MITIREENGVVTFSVRVIPRSSRSGIAGEHDGAVKVRLSAPPIDGAANEELIKLLAKKLGVPKSSVAIVSGETSKTKRLRIAGVTAAQLQRILSE
jgi:uncharacterized protein